MKLKPVVQKSGAALALLASAVTSAYAQTTTAATSPLEVLTQNSGSFIDDTKVVLFAGAGLMIAAMLVKSLVNLVISFFRRG